MKRLLPVCLVLPLSSCAFLFQEHEASYEPREREPRCSASTGLAIVDSAIAGLDTFLLVSAVGRDTEGNPELEKQNRSLLIAAAVDGLVHIASGAAGFSWAEACQKARAERDDYMRGRLQPEPGMSFFARKRPAERSRAFYCSMSLCVRDQAACERRQVEGGQSCTRQVMVFCLDHQGHRACYPSLPKCEEKRAELGEESACKERR